MKIVCHANINVSMYSLLYTLSFGVLQNVVLFPYLVLYIIVLSAFPVPYCMCRAVRDFAFDIRVSRVEC